MTTPAQRRALAWLPGRPATEGDVLLVGVIMIVLYMCTACRISSFPNVVCGITMVTVFVLQMWGAWSLMRAWEGVTYDTVTLQHIDESAGWDMDFWHYVMFICLCGADLTTGLVSVPSCGALVRRLLDPALQLPCDPSPPEPEPDHLGIKLEDSLDARSDGALIEHVPTRAGSGLGQRPCS